MTTLADELPRQQARCRELLEIYLDIGAPGAFASACLKESLRKAEIASASGDIVQMVAACKDLQGYKC